MKKILSFALILTLLLTCAACGDNSAEQTPIPTAEPTAAAAPTVAPTAQPTEEPYEEPAVEGVNFSDGNIGFLRLDRTGRGTSLDFELELTTFNNQPAVKIAPHGGRLPWLGISASALLSDDDIAKARTVALRIAVDSAEDDKFWPLSGSIYAYTGDDLVESSSMVGIMSEETNPKTVYSRLNAPMTAGANNYIVFSASSDGGTGYAGKNNIYILGIGFMDEDGNFLAVNAGAGGDFPETFDNYTEPARTYNVDIPLDQLEGGNWFYINHIMDFTLEDWNRATAIVIEHEPIPEDSDFDFSANPFVVQVSDDVSRSSRWATFIGGNILVDVQPESVTMTLEDMHIVNAVEHIGYGCWNGAEFITRIYVTFLEEIAE